MSPGDDYAPTISGTLKLKGVKASKVEKHKKKRKRPATDEPSVKPSFNSSEKKDNQDNGDDGNGHIGKERDEEGRPKREKVIDETLAEEMRKKEVGDDNDVEEEEGVAGAGKTDAERRHDENKKMKEEVERA
ncbi:hypothetical protein MMC14_006536 [Varicellaria rhodocarpa]|nr:hypothetical protein [Varicellaria rhodocarpa]